MSRGISVDCGCLRNLDVGSFQPMIDSWDLHLRAEKSAKTIRTVGDHVIT